MNTIYVMIPSLSDASIEKTIINCIENSANPQNISFGISLQDVKNINLSNINSEVRVITLPKNIIYGIGQTRKFLQGLYNQEDYILSIDCHTSFSKNWDKNLILYHSKLNNNKFAIISQSLTDYTQDVVYKTLVSEPEHEGSHCFLEYSPKNLLPKHENIIKDPHISNWITSHFIFATSEFIKCEYPIEYVWGEQDFLLAMKLFCFGFDIYELPQTFLTTESKNSESISKRTNFFYSPISKMPTISNSTHHFGKNDNFEYPNVKTYWSNHLKKIGATSNSEPEIVKQLMSLILSGQNYYTNLQNLKRSPKDFLYFHGLSDNQIIKKINSRMF